MTEPTANKVKGEPPIIRGYTREGQSPTELTLWFNTPKEGTLSEGAPDFKGHVQVGDQRVYVSAWAYQGGISDKPESKGKEYGPYLSLAANIKDGDVLRSESIGAIRGMLRTTVNGEKIDVDGSRGLKVIGELKGKTILTEGVTVSGNLNGRFPDQESVLGMASQIGFKDAAVNGFKAFIDADAKKSASARP